MTQDSKILSREAGRRGDDVRSDCWVRIALTRSGGIELDLKSKVASMYGDSIRALVADEFAALGVDNAKAILLATIISGFLASSLLCFSSSPRIAL